MANGCCGNVTGLVECMSSLPYLRFSNSPCLFPNAPRSSDDQPEILSPQSFLCLVSCYVTIDSVIGFPLTRRSFML